MNSETAAFLHDLYERCPSDSQTVFLTFTAIHPDGDKPTPSRHVPLGRQAALEQVVSRLGEANERGWGAYFGVAPRKRSFGRWVRVFLITIFPGSGIPPREKLTSAVGLIPGSSANLVQNRKPERI